jgi:hypothetical protein
MRRTDPGGSPSSSRSGAGSASTGRLLYLPSRPRRNALSFSGRRRSSRRARPSCSTYALAPSAWPAPRRGRRHPGSPSPAAARRGGVEQPRRDPRPWPARRPRRGARRRGQGRTQNTHPRSTRGTKSLISPSSHGHVTGHRRPCPPGTGRGETGGLDAPATTGYEVTSPVPRRPHDRALLLALPAFLLLGSGRAEEAPAPASFPASWAGTWRGPSRSVSPGGQTTRFATELRIAPIEGEEALGPGR